MKTGEWKRGHHLLHHDPQQGSASHRMATAQQAGQENWDLCRSQQTHDSYHSFTSLTWNLLPLQPTCLTPEVNAFVGTDFLHQLSLEIGRLREVFIITVHEVPRNQIFKAINCNYVKS